MITSDLNPKEFKYDGVVLKYRLLSVRDCIELSESKLNEIATSEDAFKSMDSTLELVERVTINGDIELLPIEALHKYAQTIISESGYMDEEESIQKIDAIRNICEEELKDPIHKIITIISDVYPFISISEIQEWPIDKVIMYFSRAKFIMLNIRGADPQIFEAMMNGEESEFEEKSAVPVDGRSIQEILNDPNISNAEKDKIVRQMLDGS